MGHRLLATTAVHVLDRVRPILIDLASVSFITFFSLVGVERNEKLHQIMTATIRKEQQETELGFIESHSLSDGSS